MNVAFLKQLLDSAGPSGFEHAPGRIWREEARTFTTAVDSDVAGNCVARLGSDGHPRVMFAGHLDEIGVMVVHVDDDGFVHFAPIGGHDAGIVPGLTAKAQAALADLSAALFAPAVGARLDVRQGLVDFLQGVARRGETVERQVLFGRLAGLVREVAVRVRDVAILAARVAAQVVGVAHEARAELQEHAAVLRGVESLAHHPRASGWRTMLQKAGVLG